MTNTTVDTFAISSTWQIVIAFGFIAIVAIVAIVQHSREQANR